jgi:general secretion pathway protein M
MTLPQGAQGKLTALGLALLAMAGAYQVVVAPLAAAYAERTIQVAETAARATRLESSAAQLPALRESLAEMQASNEWTRLALPGASDTLAAAALQSAVSDIVAAAGSRVASAEIVPPQAHEGWRRIGVRLTFSGDLPRLAAVLSSLESARPYLFADNMELSSDASTMVVAESAAESRLKISLDVFGYRADDPLDAK